MNEQKDQRDEWTQISQKIRQTRERLPEIDVRDHVMTQIADFQQANSNADSRRPSRNRVFAWSAAVCLVIIGVVILFYASATTEPVKYKSLKEISAVSDLIVMARVTDESEVVNHSADMNVTKTKIEVVRVLKGSRHLEKSAFQVVEPTHLQAYRQYSKLVPNADYILFLSEQSGELHIQSAEQGKYNLDQRDLAEEELYKTDSQFQVLKDQVISELWIDNLLRSAQTVVAGIVIEQQVIAPESEQAPSAPDGSEQSGIETAIAIIRVQDTLKGTPTPTINVRISDPETLPAGEQVLLLLNSDEMNTDSYVLTDAVYGKRPIEPESFLRGESAAEWEGKSYTREQLLQVFQR